MKPLTRRIIASQDGSSILEFAIILPLLLIITFGIIEFGVLVYNKQVLVNASREGVRAGIVAPIPSTSPRLLDVGGTCTTNGSPQPSIECVVKAYCTNHLITFGAKIDPQTTCPTNPISESIPGGYAPYAAFGTNLGVKVSYSYTFLVIPNFIPGITSPLNIEALTVMKYE
jgi:hypothetical protein